MNGVHDMGGMHGMGPIEHERNEPVFHAAWEGRVYALSRVLRRAGWTLDAARHGIELLPPAEYLRMTYYERWIHSIAQTLIQRGVISIDELGRRIADVEARYDKGEL